MLENTYENKKEFLKWHIGMQVLINGKVRKYTRFWHWLYGGTYRIKAIRRLPAYWKGLNSADLERYGWIVIKD